MQKMKQKGKKIDAKKEIMIQKMQKTMQMTQKIQNQKAR